VSPSAVGTVTTNNLLTSFEAAYGANLIGATVARIRGVIQVVPDATIAETTLLVGVRVAGAGDTTLTGPGANPYEDWMLFEPFMLAPSNASFTLTDTHMQRVIDVKSMRKLEEIGQELRLVASQTGTETATELGWALSIGLLLP